MISFCFCFPYSSCLRHQMKLGTSGLLAPWAAHWAFPLPLCILPLGSLMKPEGAESVVLKEGLYQAPRQSVP